MKMGISFLVTTLAEREVGTNRNERLVYRLGRRL